MQTQVKVFVLLTTVTTLLLALLFLAVSTLPWDIAPEWLFNPVLLIIISTLWFYSTLNTFNYVWFEKRDVLLEVIQGFSAISIIWVICSSLGLLSDSSGWITQLSQFIIIVTFFLTIVRTLLHSKTNRWSNVARWIALISTGVFTGISLVALFVAISPANALFDILWNIAAVFSIASLFLTPVLYYLPKKQS